jgi:hypothetical protein
MSRWFRFLRGDFDVAERKWGAPSIEKMEGMVGQHDYAANLRWQVFEDTQDGQARRNVLVVLGSRWTIIDGTAFRRVAEQIMAEL